VSGSSLKKNLEILRNAGFAVPDNALRYVEDQEYRQRGIKSVWSCRCGYIYESYIGGLLEFNHNCGKSAREIWSSH
jgi:hypothetical protein